MRVLLWLLFDGRFWSCFESTPSPALAGGVTLPSVGDWLSRPPAGAVDVRLDRRRSSLLELTVGSTAVASAVAMETESGNAIEPLRTERAKSISGDERAGATMKKRGGENLTGLTLLDAEKRGAGYALQGQGAVATRLCCNTRRRSWCIDDLFCPCFDFFGSESFSWTLLAVGRHRLLLLILANAVVCLAAQLTWSSQLLLTGRVRILARQRHTIRDEHRPSLALSNRREPLHRWRRANLDPPQRRGQEDCRESRCWSGTASTDAEQLGLVTPNSTATTHCACGRSLVLEEMDQ